MSLICVRCGKIIVMSNNPDHLGKCHDCKDLTEEEVKRIEDSSKKFWGDTKNEQSKKASKSK